MVDFEKIHQFIEAFKSTEESLIEPFCIGIEYTEDVPFLKLLMSTEVWLLGGPAIDRRQVWIGHFDDMVDGEPRMKEISRLMDSYWLDVPNRATLVTCAKELRDNGFGSNAKF